MDGVVEGVVFEDKDGDGVYSEGDEYLAGVTVTITDSAGNVYTVVTDTGGSYSQQVAPGDTTMTFTSALLDRLQQTTGASAVNVPSGGTTNTSAAFLVPSYVEGEVFEDVDGDGVYGIGDLYISGVNILITDSLGREYTVVTDANGYYKQQVPPGETTVSVEAVSNAISSPPPLPPAPPGWAFSYGGYKNGERTCMQADGSSTSRNQEYETDNLDAALALAADSMGMGDADSE